MKKITEEQQTMWSALKTTNTFKLQSKNRFTMSNKYSVAINHYFNSLTHTHKVEVFVENKKLSNNEFIVRFPELHSRRFEVRLLVYDFIAIIDDN